MNQRELIVTGDIVLIIADWDYSGTDASGQPIDLNGTAWDVMRRGEGGGT